MTSSIGGSTSGSSAPITIDPTATTSTSGGTTTPTSITQTADGAGTQSIGGLATGLDTNAIIAALVAAERAQEDPIKNVGTQANVGLQSYSLVRTDLSNLTTAALALARPSGWLALTATSSNTNVATVTAGTGSFGGTVSFTVDDLASAGSVRSANVISSASTAITSAPALFVAAQGKSIGFSAFSSDNALALGNHTITVTQASSAARKTSDSPLSGMTTIDGTNDTLQLDVNGTPTTLTIAHGTYTTTDLAAAVQAAAGTAGAPISVGIDGSGTLSITTSREGSAASLQVTGGNALAALNLSTDGSALTGTDGALQVDGGATQTFTSLDAGQTITLNAAAGTITGTLSGGLRTGAVTGDNVNVGDGSLASVVAAINGANAGVTATAVQVGANAYRFQVTSNTAGANNGENLDAAAFNGNVGGFVTLTDASDAQITVGSGPGAYTITSATNAVSGVLPGVTVNLIAKSTDPVTLTVSRDDAGMADKVQALVDAANKVKTTTDALTQYDPTTKTASPLTGDFATTELMSAITTGFISSVDSATPKSPGLAGVSIDKDGNFTFDRSAFIAAFDANPTGVTKLFTQGGTADSAAVQFVSASDSAVAGTYDVNITQAATQASDTGLTGAWPPGPLPTVKVRVGTTEVSYAVKNGDTRADVAAGLNSAFASAQLDLQATDTGSGVQINSSAYGSRATFDVDWAGSGYVSHNGQDVQGTIGGKAATGSGQQLLVPFTDKQIAGLALLITTNQTGDLGNFTYQPGVAQRVATAVNAAADPISGYITASENELKARIKFVNDEVAQMEVRVTQYETMLRSQWSDLEATIGTLKTTGDWLTQQVASMSKSG